MTSKIALSTIWKISHFITVRPVKVELDTIKINWRYDVIMTSNMRHFNLQILVFGIHFIPHPLNIARYALEAFLSTEYTVI